MYPLYWTSSKEGIFMRYSYAFKRKCVEMYRHQKQYPKTPKGVKAQTFQKHVREWVELEDCHGPEILKHKHANKVWTADEKFDLVSEVLAGESARSVSIQAGINDGLLYSWIRKYKISGYNGLISSKKGRKPKYPDMKKKRNINNPRKLVETEHEELVRLRAENAYIKAENAVIKKEIALREEKEAARLKAKKQRSLKHSKQKDTH